MLCVCVTKLHVKELRDRFVCETVVCDNVVLLVLNLSNFKWSLAAVMNELLGLGSSGLRSNQAGSLTSPAK